MGAPEEDAWKANDMVLIVSAARTVTKVRGYSALSRETAEEWTWYCTANASESYKGRTACQRNFIDVDAQHT